jgi:hypothetical protein
VLNEIHKKHKKEDAMLTKGTSFARYSKSLCWVISIIWLTLAILSFTGADLMAGFLWLAGAAAFAISAIALGRGVQDGSTSGKASD